jgi:hypothetical protein
MYENAQKYGMAQGATALKAIEMLKVERANVIKLEGELASMNAHFEVLRDQKYENVKDPEVKDMHWQMKAKEKYFENQIAWRDLTIKKLEHNLEQVKKAAKEDLS